MTRAWSSSTSSSSACADEWISGVGQNTVMRASPEMYREQCLSSQAASNKHKNRDKYNFCQQCLLRQLPQMKIYKHKYKNLFWTSKGILGIAKPFVQYSSDKLCFESFEQRYIVGEFSAPIPPVVSLTCSPLFSALSPIWKRRFQMISDGNLLPNIMCAMKLRT